LFIQGGFLLDEFCLFHGYEHRAFERIFKEEFPGDAVPAVTRLSLTIDISTGALP
jgi:hypothetical protein